MSALYKIRETPPVDEIPCGMVYKTVLLLLLLPIYTYTMQREFYYRQSRISRRGG